MVPPLRAHHAWKGAQSACFTLVSRPQGTTDRMPDVPTPFRGMVAMGKSGLGAQRRERLNALREAALHRPVVARHLSDGFNGRWSRRQWAQASLVATLGMLVAAIIPGFSPSHEAPAPVARMSMALPLPSLPVARLQGQT